MKHIRTVKSFVKRSMPLSDNQKRAMSECWPQFGIDLAEQQLNPQEVFGNNNPIIVEIGFGKGNTFIETAIKHPENNYIGIEVYNKGIAHVIVEAEEKNLSNVKVFQADALEVLKQMIPDNSLDAIYLFFPDPWHKKRHHKRRIVQKLFLELIHSKLKLGGIFHAATDWENYAEHMMEVISAFDGFNNTSGHEQYTPRPDYRPLTKFEKRGQRLGHGVWDLVFTKV